MLPELNLTDPRIGEVMREALQQLRDGEWHDYQTIVNRIAVKVPPGQAKRTNEARRAWRSAARNGGEATERVRGFDTADQILWGARDVARKTLANKRWFQYDQPGQPTKVRLVPEQLQQLRERSR